MVDVDCSTMAIITTMSAILPIGDIADITLPKLDKFMGDIELSLLLYST